MNVLQSVTSLRSLTRSALTSSADPSTICNVRSVCDRLQQFAMIMRTMTGWSSGRGFNRRRDLTFLFSIYAALTFVSNFPSGFTNSSVNTAVEALDAFILHSYRHRGIRISDGTLSLVRSAALNCWYFFQIFGALLSPMFLDEYGRRQGYIIGCSVTLVSTLVQLSAIRYALPEMLIVGRSLTAIASPLCDACLILYLQETAPLSMRGSASFFCEIGHGAMCVLGSLLGMRTVLGYSLEPLLVSSIGPVIASLFIVCFIPETPKFLLIMRNDRAGAIRSLDFFLGEGERGEERHGEILYQMEKERIFEGERRPSSYAECFSTWHIRRAIVLACAVLVLTLSFYPLLQSSTFFFLHINVPPTVSEVFSMVLMVVFTLACIAGTKIIDRYRRRSLILGFGIITNAFLVVFALLSSLSHHYAILKWAALAAILCYSVAFGMVLGPLSWFIAPEMVSQRHRATVFSICYAISNALIAGTNFATLPLYGVMGAWAFLPLFVLPSALALLFLYYHLPESGGLATHEVVAVIRASRGDSIDEDFHPILPVRGRPRF